MPRLFVQTSNLHDDSYRPMVCQCNERASARCNARSRGGLGGSANGEVLSFCAMRCMGSRDSTNFRKASASRPTCSRGAYLSSLVIRAIGAHSEIGANDLDVTPSPKHPSNT